MAMIMINLQLGRLAVLVKPWIKSVTKTMLVTVRAAANE